MIFEVKSFPGQFPARFLAGRRLAGLLSPTHAIVALLLFVFLCFGIHRASLLNVTLPILSAITAAALFKTDRSRYIQFVLTTWFLIPLLRRLIDFQSGWVDPSPVLLTPYFVTFSGAVVSIKKIVDAPLGRLAPYLLAFSAISIAAVIGAVTNPSNSVVMGFLNWASPIALGALISVDREHINNYVCGLQSSLPTLLTATAFYTLAQWAFVFPWDAYWVVNLNSPSMGTTDPFSLRAFGNLNSPGTCAFVLASGLIIILSRFDSRRIPAFILGAFALITTQVRAGWIVFGFGVIILLIKQMRRTIGPLAALLIVAALASAVGLTSSAKLGTLSDRIQTFSTPADDTSANSRKDGYRAAWDEIASNPLGRGLGVPEDLFDIAGSFSLRDSGAIETAVTLGWLGAASYTLGLAILLFPLIRRLFKKKNPQVSASTIAAISLLIVLPLGSTMVALCGVLLWLFLAIASVLSEDPVPRTDILQ